MEGHSGTSRNSTESDAISLALWYAERAISAGESRETISHLVRVCTKKGADARDLQSLLFWALARDYEPAILALLDSAVVDFWSTTEGPAIHLAARVDSRRGTKALLTKFPTMLTAPNAVGDSPFLTAIRCGSVNVAEVMVNGGVNLREQPKDPVQVAFTNRDGLTTLPFLHSLGFSIDVRDGDGIPTICRVAGSYFEAADVQVVLRCGVDPHALDAGGRNALHHAASRRGLFGWGGAGRVVKVGAIVRVLCLAGINVNHRDDSGLTPLGVALRVVGFGIDKSVESVLREFGGVE